MGSPKIPVQKTSKIPTRTPVAASPWRRAEVRVAERRVYSNVRLGLVAAVAVQVGLGVVRLSISCIRLGLVGHLFVALSVFLASLGASASTRARLSTRLLLGALAFVHVHLATAAAHALRPGAPAEPTPAQRAPPLAFGVVADMEPEALEFGMGLL